MAATGVDKVFDELGKMSVLDLVELKKKIEDEWGITAAAPVAVAAPGAAPAAGGGVEYVYLRLRLAGRGAGAGARHRAGGRDRDRSGGRDAPLLLDLVLQLDQLEDGHLPELLEHRVDCCHL